MKIRRLRYILEKKEYLELKVDPTYLKIFFENTSSYDDEEHLDYSVISNIFLIGNVNKIFEFLVYQIDQLSPEDISYVMNNITKCGVYGRDKLGKKFDSYCINLLDFIFVLNNEIERMEDKIDNVVYEGDLQYFIDKYLKFIFGRLTKDDESELINKIKDKYKNYTSKKGKLLL